MTTRIQGSPGTDGRSHSDSSRAIRAFDVPAANIYRRRRQVVKLNELIIAAVRPAGAELANDNGSGRAAHRGRRHKSTEDKEESNRCRQYFADHKTSILWLAFEGLTTGYPDGWLLFVFPCTEKVNSYDYDLRLNCCQILRLPFSFFVSALPP